MTSLTDVVDASRRVAETRRRLEKIDVLAALLRAAEPDETATLVAVLSGEPRQGRTGIGPAALRQAAQVAPATEPTLTLRDVDATLDRLVTISGAGSARARAELLAGLMARATPPEQDFLLRLLMGELRQGALEGLVLEAVAKAAGVRVEPLRGAVMRSGDLGAVAAAAREGGEAALAQFRIRLFQPLAPMLAQPAEDLDAALAELPGATLELKLDGARVQVHKDREQVRVYSRLGNDVTVATPELVTAARALPVRSAILDGEVIALRPDGRPEPFQTTMRRFGRKLDVERLAQELPLSTFFFDAMRLDDTDIVDEPQERRFALLAGVAGPRVIPHVAAPDAAAAAAFLDAAMARGHEGVMAKDPAAPYAAGSRGQAWLKVKPAHTLDLVVLAAEWGHGRRKGFLSNLHLGARDPERGGFVMLGKTFKGLTDELLAWQTGKLLGLELGRDSSTVHVRPELVVEIAFNDVQESPRYPGGLALRFARVRRYREDKTVADADTIGTVRDIFQRSRHGGPAAQGTNGVVS